MNNKAIIFQREILGTAEERRVEAVRLERYAKARMLTVVSN